MARYFYVKNGGTSASGGNGSTLTKRTGLWSATASDYYNTLADALMDTVNKPTDGDVVCVSHLHTITYSMANTTPNSGGSYSGAGLLVLSVDNANQENYMAGASEINSANTEHLPYFNVKFAGLSQKGNDDSLIVTGTGSSFSAQDCTFTLGGGNGDHFLIATADGQLARLLNVDVIMTNALEDIFLLAAGNRVEWNGGSITGTTANFFISVAPYNGGCSLLITDVDMEDFTGALFPTLTAGVADCLLIRLLRCTINSAFDYPTPGTDLLSSMHRVELLGCSDSTADKAHQSWIGDGCGLAKTVDTVYNSNNDVWGDGTDKSSWKVETSSLCSPANAFAFVLAEEYIDLTAAASDKVIVNMVTDAVLDTAKIAAFMTYPDGTDLAIPNMVSSTVELMPGSGATLATSALDATDWVGEPVSPNFYKLELDTSGLAGGKGAVRVRIEVYYDFTADGDVLYIDSELELA